MTEILWGPYQEHHITVRHGVTVEQFEEAWVDRVDLVVRPDDSYESVGAINDGQEPILGLALGPLRPRTRVSITAYFLVHESE